MARSKKKSDYRNWCADYPTIDWEVFSVSSGGVMHKDTLKWVKEKVAPIASFDQGIGLIRMLKTEVSLAVAKAVGQVLQLAKERKRSVIL